MKSAFLIPCCGLLILLGGKPAHAGNWAEPLFSELHHDFGEVPRGAVMTHRFYVVNRTADELQLVDVRASCGCTTGRILTPRIPPGKTGIVEAVMDTRNFVGRKPTKLFVTVGSASGKQVEVALGIVSNILADVVLNPGSVDFGVVSRGQSSKQQVSIERIDAPDWRAVRMVSASKAIDAELQEVGRKDGRVNYLLTVALKPDAPAGQLRDEIRILTNDEASPVVPVLVTGMIRGELTVSPSSLGLGRSNSAAPLRGRVLLRASRPFQIQGIEGHGNGLVATIDSPEAKPIHVVEVEFHPEETDQRGDLKRVLRFVTNLEGEAPADLPVSMHIEL
jgi:hypothetical protein